jgi:hypothetical protein
MQAQLFDRSIQQFFLCFSNDVNCIVRTISCLKLIAVVAFTVASFGCVIIMDLRIFVLHGGLNFPYYAHSYTRCHC